MANSTILETLCENGLARVSAVMDYGEMTERVRARVAMLNHNLSPVADRDGEWISWKDHVDEALLRFSMEVATSRVVSRMSAWSAAMEMRPEGISITLEIRAESNKFYALLFRLIKDILYYSILADKLTLSAAGLRGEVSELRDQMRALADSGLEDLVCAMSIVE